MMRLLLVRHAMCDPVGHSLAGRTPGIPLNAEGRRQAGTLARRIRCDRPVAVYSSPLERAMETATAIASACDVEPQVMPELTEFDFGEWTGRSIASLAHDDVWRRFNTHRSATRAPGGELAPDAQERVVAGLRTLAERHPHAVVVAVSHADIIKAALCDFLGISLDLQHRFDIAPASVSTVELAPWGPLVRTLNEIT